MIKILDTKKKSLSLKSALSLSYIFLSLLLIAFLCIFSNVFFRNKFIKYIQNENIKKDQDVIQFIQNQYLKDKSFNSNFYQIAFENLIDDGKVIVIKEINGKIVYDAETFNKSRCDMMKSRASKNSNPNISGDFIENNYEIMNNDKIVGYVSIKTYGSFYLNENAILFVNTLNKVFLIAALLSLLLAIFIGILMSNKIVKPIFHVIKMTQLISKGNYDNLITENNTTNEIKHLIYAVNDLSNNLKKQKDLRKRLTADISHELRTPIATLQSHMETILDGVWKPTNERLTICHEEILRLGTMINDLQKLEQIENESLKLNKINFNISLLVLNIISLYESEIVLKNIKTTMDLKDIYIFADKDRISQVVINIVSNALKYTNNFGSLTFSIDETDKEVILKIEDSGLGISEEDIPHIFERFYRSDKSRNRLTGGVGIGLAITKAIIEEHKGNILVKSVLGEGTTFVIKLPKYV